MSGPEEAKLQAVRTANPDTLRASSDSWKASAEALSRIESVLVSYRDELGASWTGESSERARTALTELKDVVAVHRDRMTQASRTINDAATAFDQAQAGLRDVEAIDVPEPGAAPTAPSDTADDSAQLSYAVKHAAHVSAVAAQGAAERARESRAAEVNRKLEQSLQDSSTSLGEIAPVREETNVDTSTGPSPQSTSPRTSTVRTYDPTQAPIGGTTSPSTHFADQQPSTGLAPTIGGGQTGQPGVGPTSAAPGGAVGDSPVLTGDGQTGGSTGGSIAAGTGSAAAGAAGLAAAKRVAGTTPSAVPGRGGAAASKPVQLGGTGTRGSQPVLGGRGSGAAAGTTPGRGSATGTTPGRGSAGATPGRGSATGTSPGRGAATGSTPGSRAAAGQGTAGRGSATGSTPGSRAAAGQGTAGRGAATGTSAGRGAAAGSNAGRGSATGGTAGQRSAGSSGSRAAGSTTSTSGSAGSRGAATGVASGRGDRKREDDQRIDHLAFEDDQWLDPEETAPGVIG